MKVETCEIGNTKPRALPLMIRFDLRQLKGKMALFQVYLKVLL
jgi:hypothetical protein